MKSKGLLQTFVLAGIVALFMSMTFTVGTSNAEPVTQHVTLTGYLTCTTCVLPNACKAQTRFGCTQWYVNQGAAYLLVAGETRYRLTGMEKELLKAAAENSVTISGDFDGTEVTVTSVNIDHAGK
jgi:hypothetical protein